MEQPNPEARAAAATVASCAANDCRHNSAGSCAASSVTIDMTANGPVCGTYESEEPKARP